jgi:hypothetical protein
MAAPREAAPLRNWTVLVARFGKRLLHLLAPLCRDLFLPEVDGQLSILPAKRNGSW